MKIVSITTEPILEIPFLNAGKGVGGFNVDRLPVLVATVDRLPDGVNAIVATGDLQGRERFEESARGPRRSSPNPRETRSPRQRRART
jgi:hypothetical protein